MRGSAAKNSPSTTIIARLETAPSALPSTLVTVPIEPINCLPISLTCTPPLGRMPSESA